MASCGGCVIVGAGNSSEALQADKDSAEMITNRKLYFITFFLIRLLEHKDRKWFNGCIHEL